MAERLDLASRPWLVRYEAVYMILVVQFQSWGADLAQVLQDFG